MPVCPHARGICCISHRTPSGAGTDEKELRGGHAMGLGRSVALSRSLAGSAEGAGSPALLAPNEWAVALRRLSQETAPPPPLPSVLTGHVSSFLPY